MSSLSADHYFLCSGGLPGVFLAVSRVFRGIMGCARGVPGLFRGVPGCSGVFRGVPGFTDTPDTVLVYKLFVFHSN